MRKISLFVMIILTFALLTSCGKTGTEGEGNQTLAESQAEPTDVAETEETTEEATRKSHEVDISKPLVALTFDDGPNTTTTVKVLDIIEKYDITASFFLIGNNINALNEKVIRRAYDMGCEIDNHSKSHSYMNKMEADEIAEEVAFVSDKVKEITGEPTKFFRPPYIAVNQTMYDNIDMPFICGAGCNDWDINVTVEERIENTLNQIKDGTIVLLHDAQGNNKTVEALDVIIPTLLDEGYQFVTVSELFEAKGVPISAEDTNLYTVVE